MRKKLLFVAHSLNLDGGIGRCLRLVLDYFYSLDKFDITVLFLGHDSTKVCNKLFPSFKAFFIHYPIELPRNILLKKALLLNLDAIKELFYRLLFKNGYKLPYINFECSKLELFQEKFDISISYSVVPSLVTSYVASSVSSVRKIAWIHNSIDQVLLQGLDPINKVKDISRYSKTMDKFDKFICVSSGVSASINKYFTINKNNIYVINNFYYGDNSLIKSKTQATFPIKLLTVGRVDMLKGIDRAIKVASLLVKNNIDFEWTFVGEMKSESVIKYVNKRLKKKNIANKFKFIGTVPDPAMYYKHCDIYIHCSRTEGFSTVLLEARFYGCPILCYSIPGVGEIVSECENGYICNSCNDIYSKIIFLIKNKDVYDKISSINARIDLNKINNSISSQILSVFNSLE